MSDDALRREAARCRQLAKETTDGKLAATLEAIAREYEARTSAPPSRATAPDDADADA
jgi:hypothetical protein